MSTKYVFTVLTAMGILLGQQFASPQAQPGKLTTSEVFSLIAAAAAGRANPDSVIAILAHPDGRHVSTLRESLLGTQLSPDALTRPGEALPGQVFYPMSAHRVVIKALENVGNADSYAAIWTGAHEHHDPQLRGLCLSSLACSFQISARSGRFVPDKEVIHLYFERAADTLMIIELGMRVGDIARLGLKMWTAKGGTRPVPATLRLGESIRASSARPYWEHWWATRSAKIRWDESRGLFVLPN